MRNTTIALLLLVFVSMLSGCGGCTPSHDSPEAAFEAMQTAVQEGEWETAAKQLTPESQDKLAGGMVMMMGFVAAFDQENAGEIEALLKEHGLDMDSLDEESGDEESHDMAAAVAKFAEPIKDKPEFIADAMALIEKLDKDGDSSDAWPTGKLEELKIDGDKATAVVVTSGDGGGDREPIEFRKVDGGWLVHIPDDAFSMGGSSGSATASSSDFSDMNESMGRPDEELPEPDNIPEQKLSPADLSGMDLQASITVSSREPDDLFESFLRGTQYATVRLKGQPVRDAYQYGQIQVEATDNAGQMLKLAKPLRGKFGGDLGTELVKLDHFFLDKPDEIVLHMGFAPSSADTKQISEAEGTIKLKVRRSVLVSNLRSKIGKALSDPALKSYGEFKVEASRDGDDSAIDVICKGDKCQHHKMVLVDRDGNVTQEHTWRHHGEDYTRYAINAGPGLTDETQLKIVLSGSERILVVPFHVGN
jgi:hypothetical protein